MKREKKEEVVREAFLVGGFFAVAAGLWMIYPPVALIVGGAMLLWTGLPKGRAD